MSIWIELRCENRSGGVGGSEVKGCWSHSNNGPMELCDDNLKAVADTTRILFSQAQDLRWKRTRVGWICPVCATALSATTDASTKGDARAFLEEK